MKVTVDSGKTLESGVAISDAFRKQMGLEHAHLKRKAVGTASEDSKTASSSSWEKLRSLNFS